MIDAEPLEVFPNVRLPIARTGHLIAVKVLSRNDVERPQDVADLRALLRVASQTDLARAREAVRQIEVRGYHRGRALGKDLETLLSN